MNVILYNGKIYPQSRVPRKPTVLAITGNKISAIGHDLSQIRRQYPRHILIDLGGRTVLPGLVDSHTHFYFWAMTLNTVHLDGTISFQDALEKIRDFAASRKEEEWIIGDGWSSDRWQEYHLPNASELDSVTGQRPAALFSKDQHILWVNSKALQLAGIGKDTPDPSGGKIDRDPYSGQPTGILREIPGYFPVIKLISRPDPALAVRLWSEATKIAYSRGVTGFHSMDGPEAWDFFSSVHDSDKLGFRVHYYFPVGRLDELIEKKLHSGFGDETLQVGGVKIFADGSLGAQTALMKKPYCHSRNNTGVEVTGLKELTAQIARASRHGLACAVHAIGDQAVANTISAFEKDATDRALRHRIEHLQLIDRPDIRRLKKIGLIASMQPSHAVSDRRLVAEYWGKRGKNAYIFKTLLEKGVPMAFGSDCPIEELNPLYGVHAAVNRNGCGERGQRFYPQERLTVSQAVAGFTTGAAYASGRERYSGQLVPGFQADMVILDKDIFGVPVSQIYRAGVAATIFDCEIVFRSNNWSL